MAYPHQIHMVGKDWLQHNSLCDPLKILLFLLRMAQVEAQVPHDLIHCDRSWRQFYRYNVCLRSAFRLLRASCRAGLGFEGLLVATAAATAGGRHRVEGGSLSSSRSQVIFAQNRAQNLKPRNRLVLTSTWVRSGHFVQHGGPDGQFGCLPISLNPTPPKP